MAKISLASYTYALTTTIAADPLTVASKLLEKDMISSSQFEAAQQQTITDSAKASRLVAQVINQVKQQPKKLKQFLDIPSSIPVMRDKAEEIRKEVQRSKNEATTLSREQTSVRSGIAVKTKELGDG